MFIIAPTKKVKHSVVEQERSDWEDRGAVRKDNITVTAKRTRTQATSRSEGLLPGQVHR